MPEHYFFFDEEGMPIAVFRTETKEEALGLFTRLYRRPWSESVKLGITIEKETDVPLERWDEIYNKRVKPKVEQIPVILQPAAAIKLTEHKRMEATGLESEKYMRV